MQDLLFKQVNFIKRSTYILLINKYYECDKSLKFTIAINFIYCSGIEPPPYRY